TGEATPQGPSWVVQGGQIHQTALRTLFVLAASPAGHRLLLVTVLPVKLVALRQHDTGDRVFVTDEADAARLPGVEAEQAVRTTGLVVFLSRALRWSLPHRAVRIRILVDIWGIERDEVEQQCLAERRAFEIYSPQRTAEPRPDRIALASLYPGIPHRARFDSGCVIRLAVHDPDRRFCWA